MKKSAYQKLKEENECLRDYLFKLVMKEGEVETQALRMALQLRMQAQLDGMRYSDVATHLETYHKEIIANGLLGNINDEDNNR